MNRTVPYLYRIDALSLAPLTTAVDVINACIASQLSSSKLKLYTAAVYIFWCKFFFNAYRDHRTPYQYHTSWVRLRCRVYSPIMGIEQAEPAVLGPKMADKSNHIFHKLPYMISLWHRQRSEWLGPSFGSFPFLPHPSTNICTVPLRISPIYHRVDYQHLWRTLFIRGNSELDFSCQTTLIIECRYIVESK